MLLLPAFGVQRRHFHRLGAGDQPVVLGPPQVGHPPPIAVGGSPTS